MFRKTVLTVAALASLGAAGLASTSASAGYYGGYGHGYKSYHYVPSYHCFVKKVWTYYGPVFKRVCH